MFIFIFVEADMLGNVCLNILIQFYNILQRELDEPDVSIWKYTV